MGERSRYRVVLPRIVKPSHFRARDVRESRNTTRVSPPRTLLRYGVTTQSRCRSAGKEDLLANYSVGTEYIICSTENEIKS